MRSNVIDWTVGTALSRRSALIDAATRRLSTSCNCAFKSVEGEHWRSDGVHTWRPAPRMTPSPLWHELSPYLSPCELRLLDVVGDSPFSWED
jgi:hypothetical protein